MLNVILKMTDYSIKTYNKYSDDELISALRDFAKQKETQYESSRDFCKWFGITEATILRRYGKWSIFCKIAGLISKYTRKINGKNELFSNLGNVWNALGRQPRAKEIKRPLSPIPISRYQRELGKNWYGICLEFLSWKSGDSIR